MCGPLLVVFGLVAAERWRRFQGTRAPVKDKLLRAPGESLRREIERFEDQIPDNATKILAFGFVASMVLTVYSALCADSPHYRWLMALFFALLTVPVAFITRRALRATVRQWNNSLGFRGERAVGEELNRMMLGGCRVYHDVPGDGPWNIDHVVVAPTGVFAVETKTRRKGKCLPGRKDYEVTFTGRSLEFPHCEDENGIAQAFANAKWLGQFLSQALAEQIYVRPILTLPGWLVNRRVSAGEAGLFVGNPKEISKAISGARNEGFTEQRMQQIAYQLDQRCRDVEF